MNGAESLVATLADGGIDVCFANPGTSEIYLVAALEKTQKIRNVLALFEGVVSGAADGFARMAGKPACTLLHLGPGFANSLANLHNAYRAQVPIVNVIGQHPSSHLHYDAPLTSDIEAIARPYSAWLRTASAASHLGRDGAEAMAAASTAPGQIATLIVPADASWNEGGVLAKAPAIPPAPIAAAETIERAAAMLRSGKPTAILLAGKALCGEGLIAAGRIAVSTNAMLFAPYAFTRLERGPGYPPVERIHYIREQAAAQLAEFQQLILVGSRAPVTYFAHPGKSSLITSAECEIFELARAGEDGNAALDELSKLVKTGAIPQKAERVAPSPPPASGGITLHGIAAIIGALLPENAIVVDESMTSGRALLAATAGSAHHDWLVNTGGSIGIALPLAVGAAVACPNRRVLCLTADGSAMYTLQALWTMAREGLHVTTVVYANRDYAVLKREFSGLGIGEPGPRTRSQLEIGNPDLDWVSLAKGMGVPGVRVASLEEFATALNNGLNAEGPTLIEIPL